MSTNYDIFPSQSPSDNATFAMSESPSFQVQKLFPMSQTSIILTTITGVLSTICSMITLNIIRLSNQRLATTHHRIMAFMSVFDIMASICMALTTLPMPSDDVLRFAGPMLGNRTTCQMQGFFILLGLAGGGALYTCLSWYFVCRITLKMDTHTIRKRLEPVFYVYTVVISIALTTNSLKHNLINSGPKSSFCIMAPDHTPCDNNYSLEETFLVCDPKVFHDFKIKSLTNQICVVLNVACVIIAMVVIIVTALVKKAQSKRYTCVKYLKQHSNAEEETSSEQRMKDHYEQQQSRALVIQALMYILTIVSVWAFGIGPGKFHSDPGILNILLVFKSIFFPLQGFWNLIIFVYDKAYILNQSDKYEGFWKTIKIVTCHPYLIPEFDLPKSLECPFEDKEICDSRFKPKETTNLDSTPPSEDSKEVCDSRFKLKETTDLDSIPWVPPSEDLDPVNYSEGTSCSEEQIDRTLGVGLNGLRRFSRRAISDAQRNNNSAKDIESPSGSLGSSVGTIDGDLPCNDHFFLQFSIEEGSNENELNST